jgi:hypothetical protein
MEKNIKIKSLSSILDYWEFSKASSTRNKFYRFLNDLKLSKDMQYKNPTKKAVDMGYATPNRDFEPWFSWNVGFFSNSLNDYLREYPQGWTEVCEGEMAFPVLGDSSYYFSKSKLWDILKTHQLPYSVLYNILRKHCTEDTLVPTKKALDDGIARNEWLCEWDNDCVWFIFDYFLRINNVMKKEKIKLDEAKLKIKWLNNLGFLPGEEPAMRLPQSIAKYRLDSEQNND